MKKIPVYLTEVQLAIILTALETLPKDKKVEHLIDIVNDELDTFEPKMEILK